MKKITVIVAVLTILCGCESFKEFTDRHPVATGIGAALIVGSIAASAHDGGGSRPTAASIGDPNNPPCRVQSDGSCR
jgi:hypothetical protein